MDSHPMQLRREAGQRIVGMDVHGAFTALAATGPSGRLLRREQTPTQIPAVIDAVARVKRPRTLVLEEGPLADWLWRSLTEESESVVVCDPRRNALVAKDSDKDDPIDALKLARYHDRVRNRVRQANRPRHPCAKNEDAHKKSTYFKASPEKVR